MEKTYKAKPISREIIRAYVKRIKTFLGLENTLPFPILKLVEVIFPTVFPNFNFEVLSKEEMGDKHGETNPEEGWIHIREDVYEGACNGKGRDRFTIAHEAGHFLMHKTSSITLCRMETTKKLKPYEDPEWQADAFAGELLAPSYLIEGMTPEEVSKNAIVSISAARVQLSKCPRK